MFELAGLNDRAASERRPQAPLSQGFKGPATRLLSAVREEMGTCGGEITCTGQSPESCASLTGLLTGKRRGEKKRKNLSAAGSGEKKPSLITRTPGIKAWPALIN